MLRRVDRWLLRHGHALDRIAWTLTIAAIGYFVVRIALG